MTDTTKEHSSAEPISGATEARDRATPEDPSRNYDRPHLGRSQEAYDRFASAVDGPLMVLTLLWLPVLIIPLVRPVHGAVAETFAVIDYTVWALFALEYFVKLYLAPNRGHFVRTHILDLIIVVVPFFRPARAARLANLARVTRVGVVLARGLQLAKEVFTHRGMHFVLLAAVTTVFVSAGLVTMVERSAHGSNIHNFGQGLWWAMVTVTTVGYGDRYPVTGFGQGVAVFLMVFGIGLIGVLTATVASFFVGQDLDKSKAERNLIQEELAAAQAERDHLVRRVDEMYELLATLARRNEPGSVASIEEHGHATEW